MDVDSRNDILTALGDIIEKLFKYPRDSVDRQTTAEDVNGWDSLSHTRFILEVEKRFYIEFDPFEISSFDCVGDVVDYIAEQKK